MFYEDGDWQEHDADGNQFRSPSNTKPTANEIKRGYDFKAFFWQFAFAAPQGFTKPLTIKLNNNIGI